MTNRQQRPEKTRKIKRITIRMKKKLVVLFLMIAVLLGVLIGRIMYIQYVKGATYEKIVLSQQEYDSETIPYRRGDILDAKGTILATSMDVYNVILDCKVLTSEVGGKQPYLEPTLTALFSCYPQLDEGEIRALVAEKPNSQYNVLLKKISYEEMSAFVDATYLESEKEGEAKKLNPYIKGVWFEKNYIRSYPYGALASPVLGFTRSDNVGMVGLERYYDDVLSGTNGRRYGYLNSDNDLEKTVRDAVDGDTIVSTLDANLQSITEEKIKEYCDTFENQYREGPAASKIGVVIMNPQNGEVKAMAQYPTFDLTDPWNLEGLYTTEEIEAMTEQELSDARDRLWTNYCVTTTYEPGSTAKPFTVACGLETGILTGNESYECDGKEEISGHSIHCVNRNGHGTETLRTALMDSCNDALMQMSYRIGVDNFCNYQNLFGFGLRTNIDLPAEARTDSLLHKAEDMKVVDLATNSFGQNFNVTMIQMAGAFCSLVNDGKYYQPHMVSKILDENENIIRTIEPVLIKQTVSEATSAQIRSYLYDTVSEGTGRYAKVAGYSMGGKTGTAQKSVGGTKDENNYLVSFIGFLPADEPELLIYVVIDEPNVEDQAHSTFAQNLAREILEESLPYLNIYQDEVVSEDAMLPEDTDYYTALSAYLNVPKKSETTEETEGQTGETQAEAPTEGSDPQENVPEDTAPQEPTPEQT